MARDHRAGPRCSHLLIGRAGPRRLACRRPDDGMLLLLARPCHGKPATLKMRRTPFASSMAGLNGRRGSGSTHSRLAVYNSSSGNYTTRCATLRATEHPFEAGTQSQAKPVDLVKARQAYSENCNRIPLAYAAVFHSG